MAEIKSVRWAILGAGKIAHKFAQDFTVLQGAELVGVAASDIERARSFAAQYNIPQVYTYYDLYKSPDVDAVYIATTHNFHYEQCRQCLEAGKAVLCEKPITINDAEFKKLATLAKEKKVYLMEALWTYFLPALQQAKAWVDSGRIGALKAIQADFGFAMPNDPGRAVVQSRTGGRRAAGYWVYKPLLLPTSPPANTPTTLLRPAC